MIKLSANLGFLWAELPLPDAIRAAKNAGFSAVELHWPYDTPAEDVRAALAETNLPLLGLNTRRGDLDSGENGLSAVPGRETEACGYIDEALAYAEITNAASVHVMAGYPKGAADAGKVFRENLGYACDQASKLGKSILIEPLNFYDAPDYFLQTAEQACEIIADVGASNLKLMFDIYHLQIMQGDLIRRFGKVLPHVGHVQFAAVPDRGEPGEGELNINAILTAMTEAGWNGYFGAEYKPRSGRTDNGLDWMGAMVGS